MSYIYFDFLIRDKNTNYFFNYFRKNKDNHKENRNLYSLSKLVILITSINDFVGK
jgi:hypothetical protein